MQVELTNLLCQNPNDDPKSPLSVCGYLVLDIDDDSFLFGDFGEAEAFAQQQANDHEPPEKTWSVYPLYAGLPICVE